MSPVSSPLLRGCFLEPEGAARRGLRWGREARSPVGAMRLGSGTFAACCVVVEVLGVVLFLRGFFPAPVRSSSSSKHQAEPPAPEPSAGTDPAPGVSAPRAHFPEDSPSEPRLSDFFPGLPGRLFHSSPHHQEPPSYPLSLFLCILELCGNHLPALLRPSSLVTAKAPASPQLDSSSDAPFPAQAFGSLPVLGTLFAQ